MCFNVALFLQLNEVYTIWVNENLFFPLDSKALTRPPGRKDKVHQSHFSLTHVANSINSSLNHLPFWNFQS